MGGLKGSWGLPWGPSGGSRRVPGAALGGPGGPLETFRVQGGFREGPEALFLLQNGCFLGGFLATFLLFFCIF